jgi:transcriptional regulator with XRE-family HTH domain
MNMARPEEIGWYLRQAREENALTQSELGRRMSRGLSHAAVSDIERGRTRVSATELAELAQILNKEVAYFYGQNVARDQDVSAQYLRGGRDDTGTVSGGGAAAKEFKEFLIQQKSEREGE